jgi:hypothetical protein
LLDSLLQERSEMADPNLSRPSQQSVGGRVLDAEGPFRDVRQRVYPGLFNDTDRAWRAKFLGAQQLSKREKAMHFFYLYDNPDFRKARLNPLRRLWQAPGEAFERALRPAMGLRMAALAKFATGKSLWAIGTLWAVTYYAYYNSGDWSKHGGWRVHESKPPTMPDNPSYPKKDPRWEKAFDDHNDLGFKVGGAALMPSTILNPHVTAELPAREYRN